MMYKPNQENHKSLTTYDLYQDGRNKEHEINTLTRFLWKVILLTFIGTEQIQLREWKRFPENLTKENNMRRARYAVDTIPEQYRKDKLGRVVTMN